MSSARHVTLDVTPRLDITPAFAQSPTMTRAAAPTRMCTMCMCQLMWHMPQGTGDARA